MHRPSTQEAISGDWSRRARRGVPSGRTVFIKLESYSFAVRGNRSPFSCGLRMSSTATPPPLASRVLNRGPDRSSSVAAGSTGPPAALTARGRDAHTTLTVALDLANVQLNAAFVTIPKPSISA